MINKAHKLALKSFLEIKIPKVLRCSENYEEYISLDSYIGGYCQTLLSSRKGTININKTLISQKEKDMFSHLINISKDKDKEELVIYYKLIILIEAILEQYKVNKDKVK